MNKEDRQRRINDVKRYIDRNSRFGDRMNYLYINPNNTDDHEDGKYKKAKEIRKVGGDFYSEIRFADEEGYKGQADLLRVLDPTKIYEIVKTESMESIKLKEEKYPFELEVVRV